LRENRTIWSQKQLSQVKKSYAIVVENKVLMLQIVIKGANANTKKPKPNINSLDTLKVTSGNYLGTNFC